MGQKICREKYFLFFLAHLKTFKGKKNSTLMTDLQKFSNNFLPILSKYFLESQTKLPFENFESILIEAD